MLELEPIEVSLGGKTHFPFRGIGELSFPSIISDPYSDPYYVDIDNPYYSVASVPLRFGTSEGRLSLLPVTQEFVPNADTPMGKVRFAKREEYFEGGAWVEIVTEAPLIFEASFAVGSFDDYRKLSGYWINLRLGRRNYSLRCIEPLDDLDKNIENSFLHRNEPLLLYSYDVHDIRGNEENVLIPGRPKSVGKVGIDFFNTILTEELGRARALEVMQGRLPIEL